MIFVTVGTHEQQFDRLLRYLDKFILDNSFKEKIIVQYGYSNYVPDYCESYKLLPYQKMLENIEKARVVITHGGPSSFIMPLQFGKIPIVIPRQKKYGEHVNNHQIEFVEQVAQRQNNIIPVYNISKLGNTILRYEEISLKYTHINSSNNIKFNKELEKKVSELF